MDVPRQIAYWRDGSEDDIEAAEALLEKGKFRHALFFAHLTIEKVLKAHVTRATSDVPPRTHDLLRLADLARLVLANEQRTFLARLQRYCLEGRYPDLSPAVPPADEARAEVEQAKEIRRWFASQLS
jgi:HEPN domain-containing protein